MNNFAVTKLGMILSIQAEIEGMKVENDTRISQEMAYAYDESDFQRKAELIKSISLCNEEQLSVYY